MLRGIISTHFTTLFLIVICGFKLHAQKKSRDVELRFLWMTLIACFLLAVEDVAEGFASKDPDLRFWRILFSAIGYTLRPVAALGLLMVVCPRERRSWLLWVPCLINTAINLTAFFSPIAFSFDENYVFQRGPLGYFVFIVALLYIIQILVLTMQRFSEGKTTERWILVACAIGCLAATAVDVFASGIHINEAIVISSIFFYMFLRSHDNYLDQLTSLRNRFAFYDDGEYLQKSITAVASIDMNGLKKLNDKQGHAAGDHALTEIGKCLNRMSSRNTIAYRVGGDEFLMLFVRQTEETVERTLRELKEDVARSGYSISVGYAMKKPDEMLENAVSHSDQEMYKDKAVFYQQNGRDRRSRNTNV